MWTKRIIWLRVSRWSSAADRRSNEATDDRD
jgi:hypothetical protein